MSKDNIKKHWNSITLKYQKKRNLSYDDIEYAPGYARESDLNQLSKLSLKEIIKKNVPILK
ncbi:MAG: hypothetical protein GF383_07855 [Candidatus Lokiarchaeota archaeon]|nr:hypothetical protein [Candidatus Lokiarchaeota archaeon]MBD3340202.1 hypothetical protein [Candidatus Lokiarchaeota archaeon]